MELSTSEHPNYILCVCVCVCVCPLPLLAPVSTLKSSFRLQAGHDLLRVAGPLEPKLISEPFYLFLFLVVCF